MVVKILCRAYLDEPTTMKWLKDGGYIEELKPDDTLFMHCNNDDIVGRVPRNQMLNLLSAEVIQRAPTAFDYHKYYTLKRL